MNTETNNKTGEGNAPRVIQKGDKVITKQGGNWQDWNIGSQMQPLYFSEACECNQ